MTLQARIERLLAAISQQRTRTADNEPDALQDAIDRMVDEKRECLNEALFAISCELTRASDAGREMSVDEAFERAGVCGTMREQVEAQVSFLDGLK